MLNESYKQVSFNITGLSPLMMNNPMLKMLPGDGGPRAATKIPTPEQEAAQGVYRLPSGVLYAPGIWFRQCLVGGATGIKLGKLAAPKLLKTSVFPSVEYCELFDPQTEAPITEYVIDQRRAVIQSGMRKNGVIRCRPKIEQWACVVVFDYNPVYIPNVEDLLKLLNASGLNCGVGEYAPRCGGPYGRFSARLVE